MSVLRRALQAAARAGRRAEPDFVTRNRAAAAYDADAADAIVSVRLPNNATMEISPPYWREENTQMIGPRHVSWAWDDVGYGSGLQAGRTRRQVAETMDAAMNEIGRRAVTQLPREYKFGGLHAGHRRLYERMARRLSPLYRFDRGEGLIPTPLAYANYVGQHAVRGAGLGGTLYALSPDDAQ